MNLEEKNTSLKVTFYMTIRSNWSSSSRSSIIHKEKKTSSSFWNQSSKAKTSTNTPTQVSLVLVHFC